jgi:hypothetical protein
VLAGVLVIDTCDSSSSIDTNLAVFRGSSCGNLQLIACNGDGLKDRPRCQWGYSSVRINPQSARSGESYYIVVIDAIASATAGSVAVNANYGATPPPLPPPPSPPPLAPPAVPPPPSTPPSQPCNPIRIELTTKR